MIHLLLSGYRGPYAPSAVPSVRAVPRCVACARRCTSPLQYGGVAYCSVPCRDTAVEGRRARWARAHGHPEAET